MDNQLQSVLRYLQDNKLKLVTAESCTAGMIASTLIAIPFVPVFYVAVHSLVGRRNRPVSNNPQSASEGAGASE